MLPELKAEWIAALRSGKYEQGHFRFRTANGNYCCLGVLCLVLEHPEFISESYVGISGSDDYTGLRSLSLLTEEETSTLARMNDHMDRTFCQIADYIEVHI